MTVLLLVRHGRSTSNTAGTLAGRTPGIELDEKGRSQAMTAGERLRGVSLSAAVRSPMLRCEQTLELAMASAGLQTAVEVDERFTECDYGAWSNRPLAELVDEPLWKQVQAHPSQVVFPDGEAMQQMAERMVAGVAEHNQRLTAQQAQQEATAEPVWLLVSHGDPIKALLSHALGQQLDDFQRIVVDPASISIIRYPSPEQEGQGAHPMVLAMNTTDGQVLGRLGGAGVPGAQASQGPQLGGGLGSAQE